jgi:hypothetical protein
MIIERPYAMPYAYLVTADVRRKRSTATQTFAKTGHVEGIVKEVSLSDAPVVLSWRVGNYEGMEHEVRFFDGKFYMPAMAAHDTFPAKYINEVFGKKDLPSAQGAKSSMHAKLTSLSQARFGKPVTNEESTALVRVLKDGFFIPAVLDSAVEQIVASSEEDRHAAAAKLLDDALIVKRDLWIKVEEPRLFLRRAEQIPGAGLGDNYKPFADIYFGPSGADDYIFPNAKKRVGGPRLTKFYSPTGLVAFDDDAAAEEVSYDFRNLVVHDPSVFTTDWDLNARARLVDFAVGTLAPEMGVQGRSTFTSFLEARDAGIRFRETGDRSGIDEAISVHLPLIVESFEGNDAEIAEIIESLAEFRQDEAPCVSANKGPSL